MMRDVYHTKQSQTYGLLINEQMMIWFESGKRWIELNWNEIVSIIWWATGIIPNRGQTYRLLINEQMMIWFEICKREMNWIEMRLLVSYDKRRKCIIPNRDRLTSCWLTCRCWYDLSHAKDKKNWIEMRLLVYHMIRDVVYYTKRRQTYGLLINKYRWWYDLRYAKEEMNWIEMILLVIYDKRCI